MKKHSLIVIKQSFYGLKKQAIQEYLAGGTSYRQLSAKHGMSQDVINKWCSFTREYITYHLQKSRQNIPMKAISLSEIKQELNNLSAKETAELVYGWHGIKKKIKNCWHIFFSTRMI